MNIFSSSPEQYFTCGLKVNPQSPGWDKSLSKILRKIKGATYTVDAENGMALVSGRANTNTILKKLKKSGVDVAWVKTGKPTTHGSHSHGYPYHSATDPYLHYGYGGGAYHHYGYPHPHGYPYGIGYRDPYVPNPPHFEPYSYWSTRYY